MYTLFKKTNKTGVIRSIYQAIHEKSSDRRRGKGGRTGHPPQWILFADDIRVITLDVQISPEHQRAENQPVKARPSLATWTNKCVEEFQYLWSVVQGGGTTEAETTPRMDLGQDEQLRNQGESGIEDSGCGNAHDPVYKGGRVSSDKFGGASG